MMDAQLVNEMLTHDASSNLITDFARYMLFRRILDEELEDHTFQAHFQLSLPFGNRGLLVLDDDSGEDDLTPESDPPSSMCHKPLGLWLALSLMTRRKVRKMMIYG